MTKVYKAKVSYALLVVIFLVFFIPVILSVIKSGLNPQFYTMIGILIFTYAFVLYTFLITEYRIENDFFIVKCGFFFKQTININEIKKISKTSSLMSSPAPSFDRIEIQYGKFDEIILSPQDKVSLANDLTSINPAIENCITEN